MENTHNLRIKAIFTNTKVFIAIRQPTNLNKLLTMSPAWLVTLSSLTKMKISFMNMLNKSGPSIEPRGTPDVMSVHLLKQLFTFVL